MSQAEKSRYYHHLKGAGVQLEKHFREYTTEELRGLCSGLEAQGGPAAPAPDAAPVPQPGAAPAGPDLSAQLAELTHTVGLLVQMQMQGVPMGATNPAYQPSAPEHRTAPYTAPFPSQAAEHHEPVNQAPQVKPLATSLDPSQHAGLTQNTHTGDDVIEIDAEGNAWYQREVRKPGFAKPRGRRVLRTMDAGTKVETVVDANGYTESFEVSGDPRNARPTEIKVTLPSFQTGIYKSPGMPFKIHTYNGVRGFDLEDVQRFYGGADLVPDTIKRVYVSNDLCFDITTTIRAVNDEYRERVLKTKG